MTIYDFDNDFLHYECDEKERKKLGQVWTPYYIIEQMMDKIGTVDDKNSDWYNENETDLDPTMGAGNIVIAMLYRRIVQCGQDPVVALSNVYGVELDSKTLDYARTRIENFMKNVSEKLNIEINLDKVHEIIYEKNTFTNSDYPNFVCSDIFDWNIEEWRPYTPAEKDAIKQKKKRELEEKNAKNDTDWGDYFQ